MSNWEHFQHQADIGVRGQGSTLSEAFEQAALALTAVVIDPATVAQLEMIRIECSAPDTELLLADWLNALICEMATRKMLFSRFEVSLAGNALAAFAWGEPIDLNRHQIAVEVKGATYTELKVEKMTSGSWIAQCVVDV
jgi:tRNA nucleotidyltransferase (CCA-adding enzyme)